MSAVTALPFSRPLTRADLDTMPGDGHRYELVDGTLIVSPSPRWRHQRVLRGLFRVLDAACPPELELLFAPFDVVLADDTVLVPDLLVAPRAQFTDRELPGAPLLAVEVLSPSTRAVDLTLKRQVLQEAGVPAYWLLEPFDLVLTLLELEEGVYVERFRGALPYRAARPFPVLVDLAQPRS
jgi:Uma2 family endonuclease